MNLITAVTDALSRQTTYTYDTKGNMLSVTRLASAPDAVTTSFTYEATYNQVASVTDPLNHTTTFSYNSLGQLTTITDPLNQQTAKVVRHAVPEGTATKGTAFPFWARLVVLLGVGLALALVENQMLGGFFVSRPSLARELAAGDNLVAFSMLQFKPQPVPVAPPDRMKAARATTSSSLTAGAPVAPAGRPTASSRSASR